MGLGDTIFHLELPGQKYHPVISKDLCSEADVFIKIIKLRSNR